MAASKLTDEIRTFITQQLACFDAPSIVVADVKKEFGVEVSPQAVEAYDPTKRAGRHVAAKWKAIFEATRKAFLEDTSTIPVANRAFRLRVLQRLVDKAEQRGNAPLAAQLLEQAAKEAGGAFTNRREISGPDGNPVQTESMGGLGELSQNERDSLRAILERRAGRPEGSA
jgi:hypothetical protein